MTVDDLKKLFGVKEDQELAPIFDRKKGAVSVWRKTGIPPSIQLKAHEMMAIRSQETFGFQPQIKLLPVYASIPAGWPSDCHIAEEPIAYIPFEGNGRNMGALLVDGHSMSPDIKDGEYVVYVEDYNINPGDWVVATNEFGKAMIKEYALKDGEPWLISINHEYANHKVTEDYTIIGRVIEIYSRRKKGRR